jgi:pimeloyl-ACP methyl ester carboxylesterase
MATQQMATESGRQASARTGVGAWPAWAAPAAATALAALFALLTAWWMPRGPATQAHVWALIVGSLLVGLAGGALLRRRWAFWLLAGVYVLVVEIARLNVVGPTVDLPVLSNMYGILALVLGRGLHGMIAFLPLWLGVEAGVTLARTQGAWNLRLGALARRPLVWILLMLVVGMGVLNAVPGRTPPVVDANGAPIPGSIAELTTVELGGAQQTILIRGASTDLPVMLYLSGGPGQSDLPFPRVLLEDLTQQVILVTWDQRGTGKSYAALDPTSDLTLAQAVADTNELAEFLRTRFDEEKIYLLGESWGTTLAVLAAQQRPDLYHALISSGQMVSQRETDRILYHQLLDWADAHNDVALRTELEGYGEPPYADTPWPNLLVAMHYSDLETPYTPPAEYIERGQNAGVGFFGMMAGEYAWIHKANVLRGLIDMFTVMYPQLQPIDFRIDVPRLEVPVYVIDGAAELSARRDLALEWFEALDAPLKRVYTFENSGHAPAFEQFEAMDAQVLPEILAETYR